MTAIEKDYYQLFEVEKLINAKGNLTTLGGSRMNPRTLAAMAQAAEYFVDLALLHKQAGKYVAKLLNVEAACITAGAAAAIVQAVAACMVGSDPYEISKLPAPPQKNEVIIQRSHRCPFDRSVSIAGATMVEIGNLLQTPEFELLGTINERTAAVIYFYQSSMLIASLSLEKTVEIAHRYGVPVIVDAAAELPPKINLWELYQRGADLVIFSGGKDLCGPGASGLLLGRQDLIDAAELHTAPYEYAVARSMKASKEAIFGLVSALEQYLEEDEAARFAEWDEIYKCLYDGFSKIEGLLPQRFVPTQPEAQPACLPRLLLELEEDLSVSINELIKKLKDGKPSIVVSKKGKAALLNTHTLTLEEAKMIVVRAREIISGVV